MVFSPLATEKKVARGFQNPIVCSTVSKPHSFYSLHLEISQPTGICYLKLLKQARHTFKCYFLFLLLFHRMLELLPLTGL